MWEARLRGIAALFAVSLAFAGLVLRPAAAGDARPVVTDARIGAHGTTTRFVIELSAPAPYHVFLLAEPYRAVIDLPEVDWRLPANAESGRGVITARRYGLFKPGTSRVVLDLSEPVAVAKSFALPPIGGAGNRIVLDLKPTTRSAFLAAVRGAAVPAPAAAMPAVPPLPRRRPGDRRLVAIDPGHGGIDPGTIGVGRVFEKNVTLAMARILKKALQDTGRYDAMLTRDTDVFIELRDRIKIAQQANADVFLSLHADSLSDRSVRGASVYTLSETSSDAEAAALAAKENRADALAGVDLSGHSQPVAQILIELTQRVTMNASSVLARTLVGELQGIEPLLPKTHRYAGFAVLKSPEIPSALIEMGYLSNRIDARALETPRFRSKFAAAVVRALDRFFARQEALNRP